MNLDQATNTTEKNSSEEMDSLRQEAIKIGEERGALVTEKDRIEPEIKDMEENGVSETDSILMYNKTQLSKIMQGISEKNKKLSDILDKIGQLEGDPVEVAENIAEKKFNDNNNTESFSIHRNTIKRSEERKELYTNKISEVKEALKTLTSGTAEYQVNENLLSQYEKELKTAQLSIDSNKKELDRLEKTS